MTAQQFAQVFLSLAMQMRATDMGGSLDAYYAALGELPEPLVKETAQAFAISSAFFPKVSEWHAAVMRLERQRDEAQRDAARRAGPVCAICDDTGWERRENPRQSNGWEVTRCDCWVRRRQARLGQAPTTTLPQEPLPVHEPLEPVSREVAADYLAKIRAATKSFTESHDVKKTRPRRAGGSPAAEPVTRDELLDVVE